MGSQEQLERLVGKVLVDDDFRKRFIDDPAAAAASIGITLSDSEVQRVGRMDRHAMENMASQAKQQLGFTVSWG